MKQTVTEAENPRIIPRNSEMSDKAACFRSMCVVRQKVNWIKIFCVVFSVKTPHLLTVLSIFMDKLQTIKSIYCLSGALNTQNQPIDRHGKSTYTQKSQLLEEHELASVSLFLLIPFLGSAANLERQK